MTYKIKRKNKSYGKTYYEIQELSTGSFRVLKNNRNIGLFKTKEEAKSYVFMDNAVNTIIVSSPYLSKKEKMERIK